MAKETMQAISDAELKAREAVLHAKAEGERIEAEAAEQGKQAVAGAVKEARKKAEVLCGVARADAEKLGAGMKRQTQEEQDRLRAAAQQGQGKVVEEIRKIVLGKT